MRIIPKVSHTFLDYPDNKSIAVIVYFSGCDNNCIGCQNLALSNYISSNTKSVTSDDLDIIVQQAAEKLNTNKVVLSGGDPLYPLNIEGVNTFISRNKYKYDICIFTGKDINFVKKNVKEGFKFIKINKFDITQKRDSMKTDEFFQLSSPNQEFLDKDYNCVTENGILYFNKEEE